MTRWLVLLTLLIALPLIAACQPGETVSTPIGEVTRPELVGLIDWERSPSTVVFRAEVAGGEIEQQFYGRGDIPACTVYGDNRVIWTTTTSRADDGVAYDYVSDETIRLFVEDLTINDRIYNFKAGLEEVPDGQVSPVVERITLFVNEQPHIADSLSGWPFDYFQKLLTKCRSLSQAPIEFIPEEAWVAAQRMDYNPNVPSTLWNSTEMGLDLSELADSGQARWVTGTAVRELWAAVRRGGLDLRFEQDGTPYQIALEVPNVTRFSPPRP